MTSRRVAWFFVAALAAAVAAALIVESARGSSPDGARAGLGAIRQEFGTGRLGGCFTAIAYHESRYNPRAANWSDHHADGSRGSFGLAGIGALWRNRGETVEHFAERMFNPRENMRLAHRLYNLYGLAPWGGRC